MNFWPSPSKYSQCSRKRIPKLRCSSDITFLNKWKYLQKHDGDYRNIVAYLCQRNILPITIIRICNVKYSILNIMFHNYYQPIYQLRMKTILNNFRAKAWNLCGWIRSIALWFAKINIFQYFRIESIVFHRIYRL